MVEFSKNLTILVNTMKQTFMIFIQFAITTNLIFYSGDCNINTYIRRNSVMSTTPVEVLVLY